MTLVDIHTNKQLAVSRTVWKMLYWFAFTRLLRERPALRGERKGVAPKTRPRNSDPEHSELLDGRTLKSGTPRIFFSAATESMQRPFIRGAHTGTALCHPCPMGIAIRKHVHGNRRCTLRSREDPRLHSNDTFRMQRAEKSDHLDLPGVSSGYHSRLPLPQHHNP